MFVHILLFLWPFSLFVVTLYLINNVVSRLRKRIKGEIMSVKDDIEQTIATEKAEVAAAIQALNDKVASLEGQVVSAADVAEIQAQISDILTPAPPPVVEPPVTPAPGE